MELEGMMISMSLWSIIRREGGRLEERKYVLPAVCLLTILLVLAASSVVVPMMIDDW